MPSRTMFCTALVHVHSQGWDHPAQLTFSRAWARTWEAQPDYVLSDILYGLCGLVAVYQRPI
jgi:hypothetical protein